MNDEINDALAVLWRAGREAESLVEIKRLERCSLIATTMGFNSENADQIDFDSAYFNY